MKIGKTVTPAKAVANEANSKKSTGPKSARGKSYASRGSIKYGIFTPNMLLPGESQTEFDQVQRQHIADFAPVGSGEFDYVEDYTWCYWRKRRLRRAEAGEITKVLCEFNPRAVLTASEHTIPYLQAVADMKELDKIEEQISLQARVSSENLDWLRKLDYGEAKDLVRMSELGQETEGRVNERSCGEVPPAAESQELTGAENAAMSPDDGGMVRDLLLSRLECLKKRICEETVYHGEYPPRKIEAIRNALQVPQDAVLDRLMRYENHLDKKMMNALQHLERLQRLRRGEEVPPPSARVG
jgi:hypothetical protein